MYFSMILNLCAEQAFFRSRLRGCFWTQMLSFLIFLYPKTSLFFTFLFVEARSCCYLLFEVWQFWRYVSMTKVQLQIYSFIRNFRKKVFKRRKNKKHPLELFREEKMFLEIAVLKVNRWNLQSESLKNTYEEVHF